MPFPDPRPLNPGPRTLTPEPWVIGISTEIGRGHPHYLDCVWQILEQRLPPERRRYVTVFEVSRGLSLLGWKSLRAFFRWSSQREGRIRWYNSLRSGQKQGSSRLEACGLSVLGRDLRRELAGFKGICLVEHQLVARMLSDVCRTWFVHADLASPPECALPGPEKTFVPLEQNERDFTRNGCPATQLVRTGLMIEPGLVSGAHDAFQRRLERLASDRPLTIAFFTSGAYPEPHVRKLLIALASVLNSDMAAIVFCGASRKFLDRVTRFARTLGIEPRVDGSSQSNLENPGLSRKLGTAPFSASEKRGCPRSFRSGAVPGVSAVRTSHSAVRSSQLTLVSRPTRREDTAAAVRSLPGIDAFVAPSHERTNWALGLGLPMFVLFPMIGTHAEANYRLAFDNGVAYPLQSDDDARNLGSSLRRLRTSGALANMARLGFGRFEINGAERIAEMVLSDNRATQ
jgi:hypothetical protein